MMRLGRSHIVTCCGVLFVAVVVLLSANSMAQEVGGDVLTLEAALHDAYVGNPTLRVAREEINVKSEKLPQALSGWRPTVSSDVSLIASDVDGSNFFAGGDGSTAKGVEISVQQPLFRGGKTLAETKSARRIIQAQRALLRAQEQKVLLGAATAYMDVLRDSALLGLNNNNQHVISVQTQATKDRFDVGVLTKTDVAQAASRLAAAKANVINAQGELRSTMAVLEAFIGVPVKRLQKPQQISLKFPETLEQVIRIADKKNPDILASIFIHQSSEGDIGSVFAELLPTIGLFGSWGRTYDPSPGAIPEQTTKLIGVSASIPLYSAGGTRSRIREAKYTANKRYLETLEVRRAVKRNAIQSWHLLEMAKSEIVARKSQLSASLIAQEGVRQEAEVGLRTILDSLDADQELLDAQVSLVVAERNEIVARFSLAANLGYLTPETLGFSSDFLDIDK